MTDWPQSLEDYVLPTVRATLETVLTEHLGEFRACELLAEVDARVRLAAVDPDYVVKLAKSQASMRETLDALASTTGLQHRKWSSRSYLVALDGAHIGYVFPGRTLLADGRRRVLDWSPRVCLGDALPTVGTVKAAAAAVEAAHLARIASLPEHLR
jgi:hypothetical protein